MSALQSVTRSQEKCYGTDLIGGFVFPILTLEFDYVKKDRRQRKFAIEDEKDLKVGQVVFLILNHV